MAVVTKLATFPRVEDLDVSGSAVTPSDPLAPFHPKPLSIAQGARRIFPSLNGTEAEGSQRLRRQAALERKRETDQAQRLAEAMAEAQEQGREQGHAEGFAAGHDEGQQQGCTDAEAEVEQLRGELRAAIESLTTAREEMAAQLELDLAELALEIGGQLAGGAIAAEPERIVELARQATGLLAESDSLTIRAASTQAEILRAEQEQITRAVNASTLRIVEDPTLSADGCVVESEMGRIDQRISQRMKAARDLLQSTRNED